jgi:hypothetical protein
MRSLLCIAEEERQEGNLAGDEPERPDSEGNPLKSGNPMGVTGMKQGRAFKRGESRREGAKP